MHSSYGQIALKHYYRRTYSGHLLTRLFTMMLVCLAFVHMGMLTLPWSVAWFLVYAACESSIILWWRRVSVGLMAEDEAGLKRREREMIVLTALLSSAAAFPFLFTDSGHDAAGYTAALIFTGGVVLICTAQHSLTRAMFLFTAALPAVAFVLTAWRLGQGEDAWLLAVLAVAFVLNGRGPQVANAQSYRELVIAQVEAERASLAKGAFLATISHEIRTPLNGVMGMAQAMRAGELQPDQRQRLDVITEQAEVLLGLLNDVLDMSKIEAGKLELETAEFNLNALARQACDAFAVLAEAKGLTLAREIPGPDDVRLGDAARVRQILHNLISNAIKFTEQGEVRVAVTRDGEAVTLRVSDTGVGIAAEAMDALFDKFSQADASVTRRFGGTGLGLSICRELAQAMGGSVTAESRLGQGSVFEVRLPLTCLGPAPAEPEPKVGAAPAAAGALRILVAEDNPTNQLVLRSLLAGQDLDLLFVGDGREAVEAWRRGGWDLVLMDVNMPVMDGLTATREIRRLERAAGAPRTPVVALTANAMVHHVEACREAGMDGHVSKPIQVGLLYAAIAEAVGEGRAATAA